MFIINKGGGEMEKKGSGFSLLTILTVVFAGLKLGGVIDWSWWLVLMPTLIGVGLWLLVFLIAMVTIVILESIDK